MKSSQDNTITAPDIDRHRPELSTAGDFLKLVAQLLALRWQRESQNPPHLHPRPAAKPD